MSEELSLDQQVVEVLKKVYDPEIPINIYFLGLIYEISVDEARRHASVVMTLTSPGCPVAGNIVTEVEYRVMAIDGIDTVAVELTWDPPWTPSMMSEEARLELGYL